VKAFLAGRYHRRAAGHPGEITTLRRGRQLLFRSAAVLLGVVTASVLGEVALRIARMDAPPPASGSLVTRHRSPPTLADFRDRPDPLANEKPAGVRRIVVVGDSFTWGSGVLPQDAFPDRMQAELDRRPRDPPVEVVNFSRPGWNTVGEAKAIERFFDRLAPDVLVLEYTLNDTEPKTRDDRIARLHQGLFRHEPTTLLECWIYERSALYRYAMRRADNVRMRVLTTGYYHGIYEEERPEWGRARAALGSMKALAAARGVPFLMVVFPIFDSQLDHRYRYRAVHETIAQVARDHGIDRLDLLSRFEGIDFRRLAADPMYDAHPSELAHRIAATAILEELESRGWLSGRVQSEATPPPAGAPTPAPSALPPE
jgi:lysophospholipase L1-like esterase